MNEPENNSNKDRPLPELHGAVLSMDQVRALFKDIACCTELIEILPKSAQTQRAPDRSTLTLDQAAELLETRAVRGLQLRYRYDGAEWWDTFMQAGEGFRIVRIRHEF